MQQAQILRSLVIAAFAIACLVADDPHAGTWKLNLSKSTYAESPQYKAQTLTIESNGRLKVETIGLDGASSTFSFTPVDGREVDVSGIPNATVIQKRIDERTVEQTLKISGKIVVETRFVFFKERKTLEITSTGTTDKGDSSRMVGIFEKQ